MPAEYNLSEYVSDTYTMIVECEGRRPSTKEVTESVIETVIDQGLEPDTPDNRKRLAAEVSYYVG